MPMDPKYEELEKDIVQKYGGGRAWQEMAKSPATPGSGTANPNEHGIFPKHKRRKGEKTDVVVGTESTQVLRKSSETE